MEMFVFFFIQFYPAHIVIYSLCFFTRGSIPEPSVHIWPRFPIIDGPVHFDAKKNRTKFWQCQNFGMATWQNFGRISYIITKIWQQTKCSYFFLATLPKFDKVENGIKVNRPDVWGGSMSAFIGTRTCISPPQVHKSRQSSFWNVASHSHFKTYLFKSVWKNYSIYLLYFLFYFPWIA